MCLGCVAVHGCNVGDFALEMPGVFVTQGVNVTDVVMARVSVCMWADVTLLQLTHTRALPALSPEYVSAAGARKM